MGSPRRFDFETRDHLALAQDLDLVDFERAAKVSGQKFYYLKREAAMLEVGLQRFALDQLLPEGFVPVVTPDLARPAIIEGLGFSPRGEETQIYSVADHDLCLIGTSEITLGGMYADSILQEEELPLKLAGVSHCFRTEAGAAGRESKGLYRVHQFTKVEMFVFCRPEDSEAQHQELLRLEKKIFDLLEIPYRVIDIASADLGAPAYRKFDLEAWMPGRGEGGEYGEITSTSNCTDFQSRRLKIRFKRAGGKKKNELVHTLNGTAISNARAIVALIENHQQADGTIVPAIVYVGTVESDRVRRSCRIPRRTGPLPGLVLGTAGHIDHGKTALVRSLTGRDLDRLPEEKARDRRARLRAARLADDLRVAIVDVPGHEVRADDGRSAGLDLVMLVVAADEGVMPQPRTPRDLRAVGIDRGFVVLTKKDLVDEEMQELAEEDVRDALAGGPLEDAPIIAASAETGEGIEEVARPSNA